MATKIYIDQGHNPQNPNAGAEGNGLQEQTITYNVGQELATLLRANPDFEVRLSRPTPTSALGTSNTTSLQARVNDANAWGADYFISIHTNAIKGFFTLRKNKWRDRKTHRYFKCKHCRAVLRVPKGKGMIDVTCPKCGKITVKKT